MKHHMFYAPYEIIKDVQFIAYYVTMRQLCLRYLAMSEQNDYLQ